MVGVPMRSSTAGTMPQAPRRLVDALVDALLGVKL